MPGLPSINLRVRATGPRRRPLAAIALTILLTTSACGAASPTAPSEDTSNSIAAPTISTQPQSQTIGSGATATLTVAGAGPGTLTYQWYSGASGVTASAIAGATASNFTTPALSTTSAYWVRVSNAGGSADSSTATITVTAPGSNAIPPDITRQPDDRTIAPGQTVLLTVRANGTDPFGYQWYLGASGDKSTPLAGGNGIDFVTPALTATSKFWVRVSNAAGSADSTAATVTVSTTPAPPPPPSVVAPSIASQPANQAIATGQTATLTVVVSGTAPFGYQWYSGASGATASPIAGATAASFTTPPLSSSISYWVRVSNSAGTADSATATITVAAPPPPPPGNASLEDQVLTLVNQRRAAGATCGGTFYAAVGPLSLDTHLRDSARAHSLDMATNNYVSHTSLDGRTFDQRIWQSGYSGGFPIGENISAGLSTAQAVVDGWMQSTGHCQNIMNGGFHVVGIGYAFSSGSTYRHYWTQNFGGG